MPQDHAPAFLDYLLLSIAVIWIVVQYCCDNWVSDVIKLTDVVEEETGEDGYTANLQVDDKVIAKWCAMNLEAKIIFRSGKMF